MNLIEETQLMKQSKADLVDALNGLGFTTLNYNTPLSELAEYMRWAGGLRDITLACISKSDGSQRFFSRDAWDRLGVSAKASYIRIGICIRVERTQFIIAKSNAQSETGTETMTWSVSNADVPGLKNYSGDPAAYTDYDSEGNTDKILAWADESGISFPAAKQARAYKAASIADGGYNDPTKWSFAALGHMHICYKYLLEINAELEYYFGPSAKISIDWYWTSTEATASSAWFVSVNYGGIHIHVKTNTYRVRPVARVLESAIFTL